MLYHDIPDCWPREPDDLYESAPSWAEESAEQYRCPECGYIGVATLHIQRQHGREYVDVECHECGADTLSETGDIATGGACQCCFHEYAMAGDDWCYSCAVAQELDDCRVMARTQRAVGDWERTVREITLAQAGVR